MTQEGITWTEIVAALEPVVARCEALRDEGEHLTANDRWHRQPDDAKGWKGRAGPAAWIEASIQSRPPRFRPGRCNSAATPLQPGRIAHGHAGTSVDLTR
jgi:hypothetical protein